MSSFASSTVRWRAHPGLSVGSFAPVTRSELRRALEEEFGVRQGNTLVAELVLTSLSGQTAQEALDRGVAPKLVWAALCEEMGVAADRRYGVGIAPPVSEA